MCDGIVIRLPDGDPLCIPIYVDLDRWWFLPDPPEVEGPHPEPWRDILLDLGRLRTVNRAIAGLSDHGVSAHLSEVIADAARRIAEGLPEGVTLGDAAIQAPRAATAS